MKILHTADIHLKEENSERWDALCSITELGTNENIDVMVISGDLFDDNIEASKLKVRIRDLFSKLQYRIFIIPGNHDEKSFQDGSFLGSNVEVILSSEDIYEIDDITITGLPFEELKGKEIYQKLNRISGKLGPDKTNILLYHGELTDSFFSRNDFGNEGEYRYMPSKLEYYKNMNFNYILAGHFHTSFNAWEFDKKRYFVYPGSPISITSRETGKRRVNLFTTGTTPEEKILNTPHYKEITIKLDPFSDMDPIKTIDNELAKVETTATILLSVDGYINSRKHGIDETRLNEMIDKIRDERKNIIVKNFSATDWSRILEDEIYKSFLLKLNLKNLDDQKKENVKELFLKAMQNSGL